LHERILEKKKKRHVGGKKKELQKGEKKVPNPKVFLVIVGQRRIVATASRGRYG